MEEDTSLVWRKSKIIMQEGTSLVWRKTLISMQEGRGRQRKAVIRLKNNIYDYSQPLTLLKKVPRCFSLHYLLFAQVFFPFHVKFQQTAKISERPGTQQETGH